ncbi:MAG: hypothetical protein PVI50_05820, partial [Gammaproteobacteria bacterium]
RGLLEEAGLDDDFDGVYETRISHRYGQPALRESDLDQDGNTDLRATYTHGVLDEVVILGEGGDRRRKRQKFHLGKRTFAEYDADGDGRFDLKYEYDYFEEIR